MKRLMILTVGVCLLFATVPSVADQAADEAAIRKTTERYRSALDKHDAKAVAPLLDENCPSWDGKLKGIAGWVKLCEDRFERMKEVQSSFAKEIGIDFITPDIAFHKFYSTNSGWIDADGNPEPPGRVLNVVLYVKKNGQWLVRNWFWRPVEQIPQLD